MTDVFAVKEIIRRYRLSSDKHQGQHYLADGLILRRIASVHGSLSGIRILEVGFGPGGLTRALLEKGAHRICAIDSDYRFIEAGEQWGLVYKERLKLFYGDALALDFAKVIRDNSEGDSSPFMLFSNLPYNISSDFLLKLFSNLVSASLFSHITLLLQKQLVDRITATAGTRNYGRLSVLVQSTSRSERHFDIGGELFIPKPLVCSSLVTFYPLAPPPFAVMRALEKISLAAFSQRRRKLRHSLGSIFGDSSDILSTIGISTECRAEQLSAADFLQLARLYLEKFSQKV